MAGKKGLCQGCQKVIQVPWPRSGRGGKGPPPAPEKKNIGVGLDKECERCHDVVSYAYKGPVPGLCGKCADREMAERRRRARKGKLVKRNVGGFEVEDWVEDARPWKLIGLLLLFVGLVAILAILWMTGALRIPGLTP